MASRGVITIPIFHTNVDGLIHETQPIMDDNNEQQQA